MSIKAMAKVARKAAKESSRWVYERSYVGGKVITCRRPTPHTISMTCVRSWDYAKLAGVPLREARECLRALVEVGAVIQVPTRAGSALRFTMPDEVCRAIGREVIAELRAAGLPFEDEFRTALAAARAEMAAAKVAA